MLYDRQEFFHRYQIGFSASLQHWLTHFRLPSAFFLTDKAEFRSQLRAYNDVELEFRWNEFCLQRSTRFTGELFGCHTRFFAFMQHISCRSSFALRLFMLIFTGALSMSYSKRHECSVCSQVTFSAEHFFVCPRLGSNLLAEVRRLCAGEQWQELSDLCLLRFRVYRLLLPDPSLSTDESCLFDDIDVAAEVSVENDCVFP